MKLNIQKLQSGGGLLFSAVANPYSHNAMADRQALAAASGKDSGLISDKLMEKLYEKGIPVDVDRFMNMLALFEALSDWGQGIDKRALYELRAEANRVIKTSEYSDKVEKMIESNGSWDEFAVDTRGNLFVPDEKGRIKKVHVSEFDFSKQAALTVGEVLEQRRYNPTLAGNSDIFTALGNNIGIEKINDYILGIIKAVGSTDNSSEAYQDLASIVKSDLIRRPTREQQTALLELYGWVQQVGPDALFKVKDQFKSKNMEAAMSYIFSMLPNNMRTLLVARNVAQGGDYKNNSKYAMDIISMAALAGNDTKYVHGMDYEAGINKAAGTSAGLKEGSPQKANLNGLELLIQGDLGKRDLTLVSSKYPDASMTLHGTGMGQLMDSENKLVGQSIMSQVLESGLGSVVNTNNIYFGDLKINPNILDGIIYDGHDVVNVWAPINPDGSINFDLLAEFEAAKEHFRNNPGMSLQDKQLFLSNNNIDATIDQYGNITANNMKQFIVLTGITSDEVIKDIDDNIYSSKIVGDDKDNTFRQINRIYALANKGIKNKEGRYEFPTGWFQWSTDLYAAPIFLEVGTTANFDVGTVTGHGPLVYTEPYENQIARDLVRQIQKPSSNLL